jgi:hypothetical protein
VTAITIWSNPKKLSRRPKNAPESGGPKKNGAKGHSRVNPAGAQKTIEARSSSRRTDWTRSKHATGRPLVRHRRAPRNRHRKSRGRVTGWEEWLWERFYFRSHSRLRCLGLLPLRRRLRPASCAKRSDRARLVTVVPTLSPMPNGKRLSGASGTAEFASSAIAFRIDYWLKPRPECFCESVPSRAMNDARGGDGDAPRADDMIK